MNFSRDENDMFNIGDKIVELTKKDSEHVDKLIQKWLPIVQEFYDLCKEIDNQNLSELTTKKFVKVIVVISRIIFWRESERCTFKIECKNSVNF